MYKKVCDKCNKTVIEESIPFGGSAYTGWIQIKVIDGSTQLDRLRAKKSWEFCCKECAQAFLNTL
jgi:hypothetical protein